MNEARNRFKSWIELGKYETGKIKIAIKKNCKNVNKKKGRGGLKQLRYQESNRSQEYGWRGKYFFAKQKEWWIIKSIKKKWFTVTCPTKILGICYAYDVPWIRGRLLAFDTNRIHKGQATDRGNYADFFWKILVCSYTFLASGQRVLFIPSNLRQIRAFAVPIFFVHRLQERGTEKYR